MVDEKWLFVSCGFGVYGSGLRSVLVAVSVFSSLVFSVLVAHVLFSLLPSYLHFLSWTTLVLSLALSLLDFTPSVFSYHHSLAIFAYPTAPCCSESRP